MNNIQRGWRYELSAKKTEKIVANNEYKLEK
jgi:hypothetical protein